ncbi:MAG: 3-phosphoshikimate 1-carboxyvinyltransferase [Ignavibacteriales bacterium]|nr:3-phosphoshikimate 1-carboxyvinyltransferase [Ignavibacteriales bacterium]
MDVQVQKAKSIRGTVTVPGDKSISHRALLIGSLADGTTEITGLSSAADPENTLACIRSLGTEVERSGEKTTIIGRGKRGYRRPAGPLDCGNSGTTMRLLSGILAGQTFSSELVGDESLSRRPMERVIAPLAKMGARIRSSERFTAPLNIEGVGRLSSIDYELPVASAQVKSAVLFAGMFADGITRVIEKQTARDHTERMLGLHTELKDGRRITSISGTHQIDPRSFVVPADISSAAYFIAAALILPGSELILHNVGLNPTRTVFLNVLRNVGAKISSENERVVCGEPLGDLRVKASELRAQFDLTKEVIPGVIDEIPILAVTAAVAGLSFAVTGAEELRHKESDRIHSIVVNLRSLGVDVEEYPGGFEFGPTKDLRGAEIESFGDHRIAMAFGVAGLAIPGVVVRASQSVEISYRGFWDELVRLSGH